MILEEGQLLELAFLGTEKICKERKGKKAKHQLALQGYRCLSVMENTTCFVEGHPVSTDAGTERGKAKRSD